MSETIPGHKDIWVSFVDSYAPTSWHTNYLKVLHMEFPSLPQIACETAKQIYNVHIVRSSSVVQPLLSSDF